MAELDGIVIGAGWGLGLRNEETDVQDVTIARRSPSALPRASAPTWSLRGLRLLVGHALEVSPDAVAALAGDADSCRDSRCRLLFDAIARALASEASRRALDGLLAPLLAREATRFAGLPLCELASLCRREPPSARGALALIWLLGRHPSWAARQLEEGVALWLEVRLAAADEEAGARGTA